MDEKSTRACDGGTGLDLRMQGYTAGLAAPVASSVAGGERAGSMSTSVCREKEAAFCPPPSLSLHRTVHLVLRLSDFFFSR